MAQPHGGGAIRPEEFTIDHIRAEAVGDEIEEHAPPGPIRKRGVETPANGGEQRKTRPENRDAVMLAPPLHARERRVGADRQKHADGRENFQVHIAARGEACCLPLDESAEILLYRVGVQRGEGEDVQHGVMLIASVSRACQPISAWRTVRDPLRSAA